MSYKKLKILIFQVQVLTNENGKTLHGGNRSFRFQNRAVSISQTEDRVSLIFSKNIKEENDGFLGDFEASIIYFLDNQN